MWNSHGVKVPLFQLYNHGLPATYICEYDHHERITMCTLVGESKLGSAQSSLLHRDLAASAVPMGHEGWQAHRRAGLRSKACQVESSLVSNRILARDSQELIIIT
jgi:hypothetical protein